MRELILRGEFKPGERLREIPLAERLGVSRTPVRLVLDRLAHDGLLEARATVGFVVRKFTVQDILDTIELRGVLEGTAARLAAERLESDSELDGMRESIEQTDAVLRARQGGVEMLAMYSELNTKFHSGLLDLARSPMLRRLLERVLVLPFASPNAFLASDLNSEDTHADLLISLWQHREITNAIANRESARAEALAREHSRHSRKIVTVALEARRYEQIPGGNLIDT
jgi:GntR family transcriptional regulator of vanillate catabolism